MVAVFFVCNVHVLRIGIVQCHCGIGFVVKRHKERKKKRERVIQLTRKERAIKLRLATHPPFNLILQLRELLF